MKTQFKHQGLQSILYIGYQPANFGQWLLLGVNRENAEEYVTNMYREEK